MRKQIEEFIKEFIIKNGLEYERDFNLEIFFFFSDDLLNYTFECAGDMPKVDEDNKTNK